MKVIGAVLVISGLVQLSCARFVDGPAERSDAPTWDYMERGPTTWPSTYPLCGGKKQSPINIITSKTASARASNSIYTNNFYRKFIGGKYHMSNNGHALQIDFPSDTKYMLKKGDMKYIPVQVHLHFDPITGTGSEHTLNGQKYFGEMHIVHRNSKYKEKDDFMQQPDGLLVIGIFVELVENNASFAMSLFGNAALSLTDPGDTKDLAPFPVGWLLPTKPRKNSHLGYVNYRGSLTTPPCSEIVDWVVITGRTLEVNQELAKNLVKVKNGEGKPMAGNNRPILDLNGRETYGVKGSL